MKYPYTSYLRRIPVHDVWQIRINEEVRMSLSNENKERIPYEKMDPEVVPLCKALNMLKGVSTESSCCGHGTQPFTIMFKIDFREDINQSSLFLLGKSVDLRYWEYGRFWEIKIECLDAKRKDGDPPVYFVLESRSLGEEAYKQALHLVDFIEELSQDKSFCKYYNL